ncbi:MAG TPA: serine/threonine-protein kinase, partial [Candidatus Acidoferrales bacterium]|nr:serine/threonine-protein kinase [Candidatus Acidoferrales bacterium]
MLADQPGPVDPSDAVTEGVTAPAGGQSRSAPSKIEFGESVSGAVIGPYRLLELIGEGGMGEVWLAEQRVPVRRRVALKLIKAGMDTREVVARFESERQALALMDHPAIAKVFDAGSTPQGRPYFVMEYVTGVPITNYCDEHKLTTQRRLELFIRVCEGVQHAHQKAILHRDLKPSNILVSEVDGKPIAQIIDFGVAKATAQRLTADTLYTQVGMIVGTPAYMSPEQADSAGVDVDTRTDVYSLGVILYQLLVGILPLDFTKMPPEQFRSRLREEDVQRPSTKFRTLGEQSTATAQNRGADAPALIRQVRGDLDAITLKCLEKDRARRYATPAELAADIERYLRNQPVLARPASFGYRARKYVRRHRIGVSVAAGAMVLLVAGGVAQTLELRRIKRERDRADRVTQFMTGMFKVSNPSEARGNDIRAREILDKASKDIDTGLAKDPELQAQMMHVMGVVYDSLGLYSKAEALISRAMEIRKQTLGVKNRNTLDSMSKLADILMEESHYPEAEKLSRETLDLRRRAFGPKDRDTLDSATQVASILNDESNFAEAEKINREVMETATREYGAQDEEARVSRQHLAIDLAYEGKFSDAEKMFSEIYERERARLGDDNPAVLSAQGNLGAILEQMERYPEAEKVYRDNLAAKTRILGPEHPYTLMTAGNLAQVLTHEEKYPEAEELLRDTYATKLKTLGAEHRSTLVTLGNLSELLQLEGRYAEAEKINRQTLDVERRTLGPDHTDTLQTMHNLGAILKSERRFAEAEQVWRESFERRRRTIGEEHPYTGDAAYDLASVLALEGK